MLHENVERIFRYNFLYLIVRYPLQENLIFFCIYLVVMVLVRGHSNSLHL